MTVQELIDELRKYPLDGKVGVHAHGCCPNAHGVKSIRPGDETRCADAACEGAADVPTDETCAVVIEV